MTAVPELPYPLLCQRSQEAFLEVAISTTIPSFGRSFSEHEASASASQKTFEQEPHFSQLSGGIQIRLRGDVNA